MSEEKRFGVGETVSLNSGGHAMTVLSIDGESVCCAWSVREDIKTKSFPAMALKEAKKPATLEELVIASMRLPNSDGDPLLTIGAPTEEARRDA